MLKFSEKRFSLPAADIALVSTRLAWLYLHSFAFVGLAMLKPSSAVLLKSTGLGGINICRLPKGLLDVSLREQ